MPTPPSSRSVKIDKDERGGWSSDRPRRGGGPERPPDLAVRSRVLKPSDRVRYSPGSLLVVVSGSSTAADHFVSRVIDERSAVLSLGKLRGLLAGRVAEDEVEARGAELLEAAVRKRIEASQTVVYVAEGAGAEERERFVRIAAAERRPCHLILLDVGAGELAEEERGELNNLRSRLDAGELGADGFASALRLSAGSASELKRIVFASPPRDD
jgi:hypothetical protein